MNWSKPLVVIVGMLLVCSGLIAPKVTEAQAAVAPIVSSGYLLGGSQGGKWLTPAATNQKLKGGERYRVYNPVGLLRTVTGNKPTAIEAPPYCEGVLDIDLTPEQTVGTHFAWGGTANPMPRKTTILPNTSQVYRKAIADILISRGIKNPDVRLKRVVQVDLEGDGVNEVLINATRMEANDAGLVAGNYSLVVLRKVINGKVETIRVVADYYPNAEPYFSLTDYSLVGIADLNGDGKMELVVYSSFWEADGATVYTVAGRVVARVLGGGCGV